MPMVLVSARVHAGGLPRRAIISMSCASARSTMLSYLAQASIPSGSLRRSTKSPLPWISMSSQVNSWRMKSMPASRIICRLRARTSGSASFCRNVFTPKALTSACWMPAPGASSGCGRSAVCNQCTSPRSWPCNASSPVSS